MAASLLSLAYTRNMATTVVTERPINTGFKFRLASSKGLTPQMAAAGISAHGINVPPPTQIADICPSAVNVAALECVATANNCAIDPAREMPEKPDPSSPVIAPVTVEVKAPTAPFSGTLPARATPRSLTIPCEATGSTLFESKHGSSLQ